MRKKSWRLIIDSPLKGSSNMAVDESMLVHCSENQIPTLRFYKWEPACLSLGYFQKTGEIDLEACSDQGIDVVRRPTGGRAVLHKNELTYSVTIPLSILPGKLLETYRVLSTALTEGLKILGLPAQLTPAQKKLETNSAACFDVASSYEINSDGKKLIGSAQTRRGEALLQHGSIPLFDYNQELASLFTLPSERKKALQRILRQKATTLVQEGFPCNEEAYLESIPQLENAIIEGFKKTLGINFSEGRISKEEEELAQKLETEKYLFLDWKKERRTE